MLINRLLEISLDGKLATCPWRFWGKVAKDDVEIIRKMNRVENHDTLG